MSKDYLLVITPSMSETLQRVLRYLFPNLLFPQRRYDFFEFLIIIRLIEFSSTEVSVIVPSSSTPRQAKKATSAL